MEHRQIVQAFGDAGVYGAQRRFADLEGTLVQRPCGRVVAGPPVETGQVVEPRGHVQMARTLRGLPDGNRTFEQGSRTRVVTGDLEKHGEIVQALGHVAMHGTERLLADSERFSCLGDAVSSLTGTDVLHDLRVEFTSPLQRILPRLSSVTDRVGRGYHRE